ncbi:MAG: helix-turn-helix transcriptional regulator [Clostridia bacterium]|nr:helix-turn-helix transcriptional regulator [Clostridia bacterium]
MDTSMELDIFCKNIKTLRNIKKLSKRKMAKILGIGVKSLTSIENGVIPPRLSCEVAFEIKRHFGITLEDLFKKIL